MRIKITTLENNFNLIIEKLITFKSYISYINKPETTHITSALLLYFILNIFDITLKIFLKFKVIYFCTLRKDLRAGDSPKKTCNFKFCTF
jgi:hypothetical protein